MITSSLPPGPGVSREMLELRARAEDLQRQLATGRKSETYGGLGADRTTALALRARLTSVDSYLSTIDKTGIRIDAVTTHLTRLREIASQNREHALTGDFEALNGTQASLQVSARIDLDEALSLLNFEIDNTYYFSGRTTDTRPVVDTTTLLEGDGAQAGLTQIISERLQADQGADGRGRIALTSPGPGAVNIAEDAAGSPFGLKLRTVTGTFTGATIAGPAGSPSAVDVTFSATPPQDGDTIRISFDLPDGSEHSIELTARTNGPLGNGEFAIGVDENATATNFQAALGAELERAGRTELRSASAFAAADNFFSYDAGTAPQRVAGPPFDTATALTDGTPANTVFWYKGDTGPGSARETAIARVDDDFTVAFGTRANEAPLRDTIATLAVLASETFDPQSADTEERYDALRQRAGTRFSFTEGKPSIEDLIGELGFRQSTLDKTRERLEASQVVLSDFQANAEHADVYEVSAKILALQTQLEASYRTTSILSQLSLVNFL